MKEISEILKTSSFEILEGNFSYFKVKKAPKSTGHFMVTEDKDEITVVTTTDRVPELDVLEKGKEVYTLVALNVSIPFYAVGYLAAVSSSIAKEVMNVLIISTFSKDYAVVKKESAGKVIQILKTIGMKEKIATRCHCDITSAGWRMKKQSL